MPRLKPVVRTILQVRELLLDDIMFSQGQELALEQLSEICQNSNGVIKVVSDPENTNYGMKVRISISTSSYKCLNGGIKFRPKERIEIIIPIDFPFKKPKARFVHKRYLGIPHVQWGTDICLYLSSDVDWDPFDALYGFFDQLDQWFTAASENNLDPADAPPHPPVAYNPNYKFKFIIQASTPQINNNLDYWVGYANINRIYEGLFEVIGWSNQLSEVPDGVAVAPAILFNFPFPFEYPENVNEFLDQFKLQNVSTNIFLKLLIEQFARMKDGDEIFLLVGTPMRKDKTTLETLPHITVWRIPKDDLFSIIDSTIYSTLKENSEITKLLFEPENNTPIEWCEVIENRTELINRRDKNTRANWFRGKQVLLLGCGALGSHIAEYIVRAGAKYLQIVDFDIVTPGIQVRQPFYHHEIGFSKSFALKHRLGQLKLAENIDFLNLNLKNGIYNSVYNNNFNLIIDATASKPVSFVFENEMKEFDFKCPIVSCSISARAKFGMLVTRMPKFSDGQETLLREAKVIAHYKDKFNPIANSIWSDNTEKDTIQPEPGCSEPTFIASAIDIAWYAASFTNALIKNVDQITENSANVHFFSNNDFLHFEMPLYGSSIRKYDKRLEYTTMLYPAAKREIEAAISNNDRANGELKETGGLLFGEISEALNCAWIDFASEPPSDSEFSESFFICGKSKTKEFE